MSRTVLFRRWRSAPKKRAVTTRLEVEDLEQRIAPITNGVLDGIGHPNVGAFVIIRPPTDLPDLEVPRAFCSGTLIHPRIYLTAGHCTASVEERLANGTSKLDDLRVSFGEDAFDPKTWLEIKDIITHPGFAFSDLIAGALTRDVGVVILKRPVHKLTPATLAPLDFLDQLKAGGALVGNKTLFTVVGYGAQLDVPPPEVVPGDGLRRVAQSAYLGLQQTWLTLSQQFATDLGGTGFGDSGGPTFWVDPASGAEILVSVTSWGDSKLVATGTTYRIDIAPSLDFINSVIAQVASGALIVAGDPNGDPPDSPDNRVDPNTKRSPFAGVGSLRTAFQVGEAVPFVGGCSAAAIGPRHVLTAAHCVDANFNGRVDPGDDNVVEFWLNLDTDSPVDEPDVIIPAVRWYPHPDAFNPGNAYFHDDIGVIELSQPLPAGVPFYELYTGDLAGQTLHMVGYGRSGDGVNGFTIPASRTVKRVGQNVADYFEGQDDHGRPEAIELWRADFDHPTDASLNVFGGPSLGNDTEANPGHGDSGGPAFVLVGSNPNKADSYRIGGVMTHFTHGLTTFPLFGSVMGGTVVSAYLDWIESILAGNPPSSAGSGESGSTGGSGGLSDRGSGGEGGTSGIGFAGLVGPATFTPPAHGSCGDLFPDLWAVGAVVPTAPGKSTVPRPSTPDRAVAPRQDVACVDDFFATAGPDELRLTFPGADGEEVLDTTADGWLPDREVLAPLEV
jgi:V8-like Glu-specific endopeptidase